MESASASLAALGVAGAGLRGPLAAGVSLEARWVGEVPQAVEGQEFLKGGQEPGARSVLGRAPAVVHAAVLEHQVDVGHKLLGGAVLHAAQFAPDLAQVHRAPNHVVVVRHVLYERKTVSSEKAGGAPRGYCCARRSEKR